MFPGSTHAHTHTQDCLFNACTCKSNAAQNLSNRRVQNLSNHKRRFFCHPAAHRAVPTDVEGPHRTQEQEQQHNQPSLSRDTSLAGGFFLSIATEANDALLHGCTHARTHYCSHRWHSTNFRETRIHRMRCGEGGGRCCETRSVMVPRMRPW